MYPATIRKHSRAISDSALRTGTIDVINRLIELHIFTLNASTLDFACMCANYELLMAVKDINNFKKTIYFGQTIAHISALFTANFNAYNYFSNDDKERIECWDKFWYKYLIISSEKVNVFGGGVTGQAEAIRLAITRALVFMNEEHRLVLKPEGLLTRDPRMVERKKFGQKKARKKFQFSKR